MTESGILIGYGVGSITAIALSGLCSVSCAGCITVGNIVGEAVAESVNCLLCNEYGATYRAVRTFGKTGFGAGRSNSGVNSRCVRKLIDCLSFTAEFSFTYRAVYNGVIGAFLGAGRFYSVFYYGSSRRMTESVNCLLSNEYGVTYRAV